MRYGMIFKGIVATLLLTFLWAAMPALAARNLTVAVTTAGTSDNYTLEASLQVDAVDTGKSGVVYVTAMINGWLYVRDTGRNWLPWSGGKLPAYFAGTLGTHKLALLENADARPMEGAEFYVAYGLDEADMLANGSFKLAHKMSADTVSIEGKVYIEGTTTPIAGAVVSTSLDGQTATTDAAGNFRLVSKSPVSGGNASYTISISASGYQTFSKPHTWGDHPAGQSFYLTRAVANANPLLGVWRQTAVSDPRLLTGQVIAFSEGGVMSSDDPYCTYLGGYAVSGDRVAMVPANSLTGGSACPVAGAAVLGKFTLSGDTLTIVADSSGIAFTFQKVSGVASSTGTWASIYSADPNAPTTTFTLDAAGNLVENSGQCIRKATVTVTPVPNSPLVLKWTLVEGDNNGACGTEHFPGKTESALGVIAGNIMYLWTDRGLRAFRKKL